VLKEIRLRVDILLCEYDMCVGIDIEVEIIFRILSVLGWFWWWFC